VGVHPQTAYAWVSEDRMPVPSRRLPSGTILVDVAAASDERVVLALVDAGLGEMFRQLDYKTRWYGSHLVKADRWFPSSKNVFRLWCGENQTAPGRTRVSLRALRS
jgi:hypothetical protein